MTGMPSPAFVAVDVHGADAPCDQKMITRASATSQIAACEVPATQDPLHSVQTPDLVMARRFLDLVAESEEVTFQTFDDGIPRQASLSRVLHGSLEVRAAELADFNARGAGVFWTVNRTDGGGRKAENITGVRALFVDLDGAPLQPLLEAALGPHAVVESSPGRWHGYWLVEGCELCQFKPAQLALAAKFGGDSSVSDLPRVMRLPGFLHRKGEPVLTRTTNLERILPYRFDDLVRALEIDMAAAAPMTPKPAIDAATGEIHLQITPGGRHAHLVKWAGQLNWRGLSKDVVRAAVHEENQRVCRPPKADAEVDAIVADVWRRYAAQHGRDLVAANVGEELVQLDAARPAEGQASSEPGNLPGGTSGPRQKHAAYLVPDFPQELLDSMPQGMLKDFVDWTCDNSPIRQPALALGAGLCMLGTIMAHKFETRTGLRTDMRVFSLARSGAGKNGPRNAARAVMAAAGLSKSHLGGTKLVSGAGLWQSLEFEGSRLYLVDEAGRFLQGLIGKNAATHEQDLINVILQLATDSNQPLVLGAEYADRRARPRIDLAYPCASLYLSTTHRDFVPALGGSLIGSGLMGRFLTFSSTRGLEDDEFNEAVTMGEPPEGLIAWITVVNGLSQGLLTNIASTPFKIVAESSAAAALKQLRSFQNIKMKSLEHTNYAEIWARAQELAEKVSAIVAVASMSPEQIAAPEPVFEVGLPAAQWAIAVVKASMQQIELLACEHMVEGPVHQVVQEVLRVVRRAGANGMRLAAIRDSTNRFKDLPARERHGILDSMFEDDSIRWRSVGVKNAKHPAIELVASEHWEEHRHGEWCGKAPAWK